MFCRRRILGILTGRVFLFLAVCYSLLLSVCLRSERFEISSTRSVSNESIL